MINLLPDNYKKEIRAARTNVILLRYNFLFLASAGFILASSLVIFVLLRGAEDSAKRANEVNSSEAVEYTAIKNKADEYRKNLGVAKKILDNEVVYTDKVFALTKLLPEGVILDSLNLNAKEFGSPSILSAHAKDYAKVTLLKESLEKSTVVSDVHFQSIMNDGGGNTGGAYPIAVSISVTINKVAKK